jgi:NAD(P)-dependent dehydrogenase (short-subunit alcohol dehydrogenase family)
LAGKVALVAGATVYVTGRTTRTTRSEMNRPETIEETATLVDEAGGRGIALQVDHLVPDEVRALVTRIEREQGLHVLVNDIWGATVMEWNKSVWESCLDAGLRTLRLAVDTHAITSHFALPLLIKTPGGLVVEVTDGTGAYNATRYRVSFFYDLAKAGVNRMAFALAHELRPHSATAVSLTPGWLRSEAMLEAYGVTESNWRDATKRSPHFAISESPAFVGRAVAALAQDRRRVSLTRSVRLRQCGPPLQTLAEGGDRDSRVGQRDVGAELLGMARRLRQAAGQHPRQPYPEQ